MERDEALLASQRIGDLVTAALWIAVPITIGIMICGIILVMDWSETKKVKALGLKRCPQCSGSFLPKGETE